MSWKYDLEPCDIGLKVVERYENGMYASLGVTDWIFESKEDAIETLEMMLKDLKGEKQDEREKILIDKINDEPYGFGKRVWELK